MSGPVAKRRRQTVSIPRCPCSHGAGTLAIGSACSGWCSELFAARKLNLLFEACFACDICPTVTRLTQALWPHHAYYNDMMGSDFMNTSPSLDLFLCGAPCQGFSLQGLGGGLEDERGWLLLQAVAWIQSCAPKTFILEQVLGLLVKHADVMLFVVEELSSLKDNLGRPLYSIEWQVLNPCKHAGVPQNRDRIFIVGIRNDIKRAPLQWPREMPMRSIQQFVNSRLPAQALTSWTERENLRKAHEIMLWRGLNPATGPFVVDVSSGLNVSYMKGCSPCLTRSRAGSGGYYLSWLHRKMSTEEILLLQGVKMNRAHQGLVTPRQLRQIAGNAISVDVLAKLMHNVLEATRLTIVRRGS
ncbi:unnamed protein product [Effrenium voratum]|nr:unnamed protein product [Effrenium voratum]